MRTRDGVLGILGVRQRRDHLRLTIAARLVTCVAGLVTLASAGPVTAQTPADSVRADSTAADTTVVQLDAIRVRATRPLSTTAGASAVRLSLSSPRLAPVPILEDALRAVPFVQVRENSRGEAQLTLRGTESRQVAVLVDGIPLTLGWDSRTDLSIVPVAAARQVQLFRGLSSVLHGPNVLGGVVEVDISRGDLPPDPPASGLDAGIDDTGAAVAGVTFGRQFQAGDGRLSVHAGAGVRSRSSVPLASGIDQPLTADEGRRLNSDLDHLSGFFAARYGADTGGWISLSSFAFRAEKGVPPELHIQDPRLWRIPETARVVTAISAGTGWRTTPLGEGDLEASLGLDFGEAQIDSYETLAYQTVEAREFADDRTITARLLGDHTLGGGTIRSAFTWAETRHVERFDPGDTSRFRQRLFSLGVEVEQPLVSRVGSGELFSDLRVTLGGSFDRASTPETGGREARDPIDAWGARLGASARVGSGDGRLHLGVSRRVRFPSLRELYSGALGRFVPNPGLQPEALRTIEAGVTGGGRALSAELEGQVVFFHQRFSDAIVRTGLGDGRFMRENRNRVTAAGMELLASLQWSRVELGGSLTWQDVRLTDLSASSTQRRAEYQPEIAGGIDLTGRLPAGLTARLGLEIIGRQFCVDPEAGTDVALDPAARLDFHATREWKLGGALSRLQTTVSLDNLTDQAVFDQCGLPRPGRLLRLQVRIG